MISETCATYNIALLLATNELENGHVVLRGIPAAVRFTPEPAGPTEKG